MSQVSFTCVSNAFIQSLTLALALCGLQAEENKTTLVKPSEKTKIVKNFNSDYILNVKQITCSCIPRRNIVSSCYIKLCIYHISATYFSHHKELLYNITSNVSYVSK